MLTSLRTGTRFRLALVLAAFAAFCFIAPPAVLAFGHGNKTLGCLAQADLPGHGAQKSSHKGHHDPAPQPADHNSTCCGLFCLSAIAPAPAQEPGRTWLAVTLPTTAAAAPPGQTPKRLDRPPIPLFV